MRSETPRRVAISAKENPQKNERITQLGERRRNGSQFVERITQARQFIGRAELLRRCWFVFSERDLKTTIALRGLPASGEVDDQTAHRARRIRQKTCTVRKGDIVPPGHVEIGLVEQRRRRQRQRVACSPQRPFGEAMELRIEHREE